MENKDTKNIEQEISLEELDIKVVELEDAEMVARPTQTAGH